MSAQEKASLLIANSHAEGSNSLSRDLAELGYGIRVTSDLSRVLQFAGSGKFALVLLDVDMFDQRQNGFDVLRHLVREYPTLPVLAMGEENTVLSSLLAARFGARDYFAKPYSFGQLASSIAQHLKPSSSRSGANEENLPLAGRITGNSKAMQETVRRIGRAMGTSHPVMFLGDPGSGKLTMAHMLVDTSRKQSWMRIDAATVSTEVRKLCQKAKQNSAPLILHRVDRFSDDLATTVLSELVATPTSTTVRLIGTFSPQNKERMPTLPIQELLDHVNVLEIPVPPISARQDDIPDLVKQFLTDNSKHDVCFSEEAMNWLAGPGRFANIRTLHNFVVRAAHFSDTHVITVSYLQNLLAGTETPNEWEQDFSVMAARYLSKAMAANNVKQGTDLYRGYVRQAETPLLKQVMEEVNGNQVKAARMLGINRNTLRKKLELLDANKKP